MTEFVASNEVDLLTDKLEKVSLADDHENIRTAIFTFGRFQPPTRGHDKLIKKVIEEGEKLGADTFVFSSLKQNKAQKKLLPQIKRIDGYISNKKNENPLTINTKIDILNKMYPGGTINFINGSTTKSRIFSIQTSIQYLKNKGYNEIYLVVGSVRFKQFHKLNFEKIFGITLIENERILDEDVLDKEELADNFYELGKLNEEQIDNILYSDPIKVSGTATRQAAAEHRIAPHHTINKYYENGNDEKVKKIIYNENYEIKKDLGFFSFKEKMSNKLTPQDLEWYIYNIKKNMGLNPFKEYRNTNPKLRRTSTRKKKAGRKRTRRRKRTKKKRRRKRTKKRRKSRKRRRRKK